MKPVRLIEIFTFLEAIDFVRANFTHNKPHGHPHYDPVIINTGKSLESADVNDLAYYGYTIPSKLHLLEETHAQTVIVSHNLELDRAKLEKIGKNLLFVKNPRLAFMKIMTKFFFTKKRHKIHPEVNNGVHPHGVAKNVNIGRFSTLGKNVIIGENTYIANGVHILDDVTIGKNCIIHPGVVIGADGFGFEKDERGEVHKFPHVGGVVIGDNVEIGANTCIDRGALDDTIIENGVKIDNLVHIAHNVKVEKNSFVIALSMVAGSVIVGEGSWIAPSSSILDGLKIGKNSMIGMGAVVIRNTDEDSVMVGVPAKDISQRQ